MVKYHVECINEKANKTKSEFGRNESDSDSEDDHDVLHDNNKGTNTTRKKKRIKYKIQSELLMKEDLA